MASVFWKGADVSFLDEIEEKGGRYFFGDTAADALAICKELGFNCIRLRLWNDPEHGYCGPARTLAMARRVHAMGMQLMIDFHYSDTWADPGKQFKPAAWRELPFDALVDAVHEFTRSFLQAMVDQGTPPAAVQIGNEVTYGMLWEDGRVPGPSAAEQPAAWERFARLLAAGSSACRKVLGRAVDVVVHIDRGGDNAGSRFFLDHLLPYDVDFDTLGLSFYPWWHGTLAQFEANVCDLATRYAKDIALVETAYPWADNDVIHGNPWADDDVPIAGQAEVRPSVEGQRAFLASVFRIMRNLPGDRGKGVFYWEPAWIPVHGQVTGWHYNGLFDLGGRVLPSATVVADA
ncbi:hypothetical protein GCM10010885_11190 [Alicyclobacillus cellulosilyticus]|uniref:Arabinogalactan endo-beta-1,4-galactanase n=1 Tax=Alicyclobacillus cellulosilyticus TaxID=1003997 RepID=A0A917K9U4_9BACL|nr:glycosyl hydrolase 53 family protein [Alicyclobacillus cellulosilyticus]GGJ03684.1 hypothetical protein GCM10010885_11190 [Alicyclobacillus cellulosilyticus]